MKHIKLRNKLKFIVLFLTLIVVVVSIIIGLIIKILPKYEGEYNIDDYARRIEMGYKSSQTYPPIKSQYDACEIACVVLNEAYPEKNLSLFDLYYKKKVYYDQHSDTWLVWFSPPVDVLDGGFTCIISSDGTVISCW